MEKRATQGLTEQERLSLAMVAAFPEEGDASWELRRLAARGLVVHEQGGWKITATGRCAVLS
jgi:hypothetical protein